MSSSQLKRLTELESENIRLKKMYADVSLVHNALKDVVEKKALRPVQKWEVASHMIIEHGVSERQACKAVNLPRSTYQYKPKDKDDTEIITILGELVDYNMYRPHKALGYKTPRACLDE